MTKKTRQYLNQSKPFIPTLMKERGISRLRRGEEGHIGHWKFVYKIFDSKSISQCIIYSYTDFFFFLCGLEGITILWNCGIRFQHQPFYIYKKCLPASVSNFFFYRRTALSIFLNFIHLHFFIFYAKYLFSLILKFPWL